VVAAVEDPEADYLDDLLADFVAPPPAGLGGLGAAGGGIEPALSARPARPARAEVAPPKRKTVEDYMQEARAEAEIRQQEARAEAEAEIRQQEAKGRRRRARSGAPAGGAGENGDEELSTDTGCEIGEIASDILAGLGALSLAGDEVIEDREYQTLAISAALAELGANKRAILQMACRCGKTRVAHGVILDYLARPLRFEESARPRRRAVLYLVPSLALLRQTALKLDRYGVDAEVLLVGSDSRPITDLRSLRPSAAAQGPQIPRIGAAGTTDPAEIRRACGAAGAPLVVISTYQSSPLLPDVFDLTVFDESHRVCGDPGLRPSTHVLLNHASGDRLYMTATPRYDAPLSMKDRTRFGGVAFAYHMREGIDAGYVNDFGLELVARAKEPDVDDKVATAAQIVAALGVLSEAYTLRAPPAEGAEKLLVFCRSIDHATVLCGEVRAALAVASPGGRTACLTAHSRMSPAQISENLTRFCAPGEPAVLFNCRLFQEGVEIPALNGVFFASPRHSPRDIIQSLCRPLNVLPGKPPSKVFIPVAYDAAADPDAPANLERFASIIPYFDALVSEDPLLYEHLLDPQGTAYPLRWVDSAAKLGGKAPLRYQPAQLLSAAIRSVRRGGNGKTERLLRTSRIPWEIGFAELSRIVHDCGRYPKTTDACIVYGSARVNFSLFYHHARECYVKRSEGKDQPLEPHQLNALAALPGWSPYGVEGPYPWRETLEFLERWLAGHDGSTPMVEINKGGYVGLEATPIERLSGTLTCINQSDGRDRRSRTGDPRPGSGFTLNPAKQKDLDELCARWGLRWRKDRSPAPEGSAEGAVGSLVENEKGEYAGRATFIQEAYRRFKVEWAEHGEGSAYVREWLPFYPLKHFRQERPDVWARKDEIVPPRWRGRAARARAGQKT
jgi:superfamily II DNA or RNA helicase